METLRNSIWLTAAVLLENDYSTALREWTPLYEDGDSFVQFSLGLMYNSTRVYKTAK